MRDSLHPKALKGCEVTCKNLPNQITKAPKKKREGDQSLRSQLRTGFC
jgi:hypothetical protein